MDLNNFRKDYTLDKLSVSEMHQDPIAQFSIWLEHAASSNITEPNAMFLSTVSESSVPASRTVLLKEVSAKGFVFFTNYNSRKARHMELNNQVALLFYWGLLERQVRIEGVSEKISPEQSDKYFESRPEGSKLGAWASPQSEIIPNRTYLETLEEDYRKMFSNKPVKRPSHWGGYIVIPFLMEFWQGRKNRLHDRIEYVKKGNIWAIHRLAP